MELAFSGTSAGVSTRTRNMTSVTLNLQQPTRAKMWLLSCGEGIQHQLLHTPYHPDKLNKIFITYPHGDHLFDLPSLLCSRSVQGNSLPLTFYRPKGFKKFVKTALRLSSSQTDYPLIIIEVGPGLVFDGEDYRVTAYPLSYPVKCYGYRIKQHDKPGTLDAAQLIADDVSPGPLFRQPGRGQHATLEDDRVIDSSRCLGPATPGKTLTIFGDTASCPQALEMARGADVMAHKTTLEQAMAGKASSHGHSSSQQTAAPAKEAGVGMLIAIHFSSRYDAEGYLKILMGCREIFTSTLLARNLMVYRMT